MKLRAIKKAKEIPLLYLEWIDSTNWHGWKDVEELEVGRLVSVGFLVREDKECIFIAGGIDDINEWHDFCAVQMIPKACIKKRRRLKIP